MDGVAVLGRYSARVEPGTIVADRFEILAQAGAGGMGVVFRALDRESGRDVALKLMIAGSTESARFDREARVLAALEHPAIVRHVAHGTTDSGAPWLAMAWLEGEDLGQRLSRGGLGMGDAVTVAERLAAALACAHGQGIVHRDLKPNNVFLEACDPAGARLLDFGIARRRGVDTRVATGTGVIIGTPAYMAPEQARADRDVDVRADLYSLGAVLFHCLTGAPPFEADGAMALLARVILDDAPRARALRPEVPEELDALVAGLLEKSPGARPATAEDLLRRLARVRRAIDGLPTEARGAPAPPSRTPVLSSGEQRVVCVVLATEAAATASPREDPTAQPAEPATLVAGGALDAALAALTARHGGHDARIERLGEGALLFVLGGASADDVVRAARAALTLRALLPTFAVVVASGRGTLSDRGPVGEVVARAAERARSQGDSAPGILLDETVAALLEGLFVIDAVPGRLELVGERDDDEARPVLGVRTPCVGRERELGLLAATFDEVASDEVARAVVITGAAGSGKSRVRREQLAALAVRSPAPTVWRAHADPLSVDAPLSAAVALLAAGLRTIDGDPRRALASLSPALGGAAREHLLASLAHRTDVSGAPADPAATAERTREAWIALVGAAAARPLVLVLEDAQWADAASLQLLDELLRELAGRPLLVVAYARPSLWERFPRLFAARGALEVRLAPLSRRACERLVARVLGSDVPPELVARLVERADGSPFFLEELMRAARAGLPEIPESLVGAVQARLASLSAETRRVLRAASVFGEHFWPGGVAALTGEERGPRVEERLRELREIELVARESETRFAGELEHRFQHALVRDAVYESLTDEDRTLGHRLAAQWLSAAGEGPARLAVHWELGAEPARAVECLLPGVEDALDAGDTTTAEIIVQRVERLAREAGILGDDLAARLECARGHVAHLRHDLRGSLAHAHRAMSRSTPHDEAWAHAAALASIMAARLGDLAVLAEIEAALLEAGASAHPLTIRTLPALARHAYMAGEDARGDALLDLAAHPLDWYEQHDLPTAALLHAALTHRLADHEDLDRRLAHATAACALARASGDSITGAYAVGALAWVYLDLGHWDACEAILRTEILEHPRRKSVATLRVGAEGILARVHAERGEHERAAAVIEETVREYARTGDRRRELHYLTLLADVLVTAGDPRAGALLAEAPEDLGRVRGAEATFHYQRARFRRSLGDVTGAEEAARAALACAGSACILAVDLGARGILASPEIAGPEAPALQAALAERARGRLAAFADPEARELTRRGLREVREALEPDGG